MTSPPTPPSTPNSEPTAEPELGAAKTIEASSAESGGGASFSSERARRIQRMFGAIAPTYDLNNHLLSLNIDKSWRNKAVKIGLGGREESTRDVLDCCTGTGDLAFAFSDALGAASYVVGTDFTPQMLELAQTKAGDRVSRKKDGPPIGFLVGDTMKLPFADDSFDLATVAFGIRNVAAPRGGLREMLRVVRPGGRILILEFSPLRSRLLRWSYRFYFTKILPFLGGVISGRRDAYRYLAESVGEFPDCEEFKKWMEDAGARDVRYRRLSFGIAAIHIGEKPR